MQPNIVKLSCVLILIGAFIDGLDGKLARYLNSTSDLGKQLDSFADLITFGLAPISIIWKLGLFSPTVVGFLLLGSYPLAGAFRLARYNIGEYRDYFVGLPITAAGTVLSLYILGFGQFFSRMADTVPAVITTGLVVLLAVLMVGKFKVKRIGVKSFSSHSAILTVKSNGQTEEYQL